ncbi:hypothetical protein JRF84_31680 [Methylobacterium organophilum]|jgi:hypothetical protein|uniref:hypothetical protein n=1 Tax=Methylobacterium organophilum TaxID=410 RepID=UPI0019D21CC7|nr:hypothetical protein [Methylobacterium organophilum]MBN6824129.1 hypothetical protein [Methylobacterium organophilum]
MRYALAAAIIASGTVPALATMPRLTPLPKSPTVEACRTWAAAQDGDARDMWGILPNGEGTEEVGSLRLTLYCLGDPTPDVVGFGSSAGGVAAYCKRHPRVAICKGQ